VGIAAFMLRVASHGGLVLRKIQFMYSELSDYHDVLVDEDRLGQGKAIIAHLHSERDRWDVIDLRNMTGDTKTALSLKRAIAEADGISCRFRPDERCPYLPIRTDWPGILQTLSTSSRQTFRNQAHRLTALE